MLLLLKRRRPWRRLLRGFSVWSFGDASNGALGLDSPMLDAYEPSRVDSLPESVVAVAAGHYHSLAVTAEGEIWAWGRNEEGQLGRGGVAQRDTWRKPEKVIGLDHVKVRAAFASGVVSAAVGVDGSLWVWGKSKRGQLGLGKGVVEAVYPSKVEALSGLDITKVSFGWGHALAQTKEGKLFGWGYSEDGRSGHMGQTLNTATTQLPRAQELVEESTLLEVAEKLVAEKIEKEDKMPIIWQPTMVTELSFLNISDIACGLDHSLVLCSDGKLLSFGSNTYGQLGRNTEGSVILPVLVDLHPLTVSAGLGHSLVLCRIPSNESAREDNAVLSWGWNCSYQLGRQGPETIPGLVEGLEGERPVSISAGRVHSIVLTSKGEVWSWGSGRNGRLGLGSSTDEMEPALIESLDGSEVLQAVAGFDHNLLLVAE
ncbi:ultraviolet-B receptor UVR8 [Dioscorea cayenensis subsp. rotundata]|uniref:Ultraviolet-B receptor UVR8 n=1 Tax=Dioscorea cayennensis subsp. rotundata TaxID=55577 RepID=A0AB40BA96_DIOCR|nr:ultraviolet-B receptor UVR8 [Dioscorea cayenensis subsp. rotundata]XP_039123898.1 ultraviolet-B receptor UVR8 [Dioscorea cayenensis subsp. rotundata]